ncbi:MAG: DUF4870 domain-containing protein [Lachnospirales bacterium]
MNNYDSTTLGLSKPLSDIICYLFPIFAVVVFFTEKKQKDTKFVAMQAILLGLSGIAIKIVLGVFAFIPLIRIITSSVATIITLFLILLAIFLCIKAYSGERVRIPLIAEFADIFVK